GIAQVGIFLSRQGKGTHAEHAILALQPHVHTLRELVGHQRRNAGAELDIEAVAQFVGGPGRHLFAGPGPYATSSAWMRTVRCSICLSGAGTWTTRSTKIPGVWIWSGSIEPVGTRCSTSATVTLPAVAIIGLK